MLLLISYLPWLHCCLTNKQILHLIILQESFQGNVESSRIGSLERVQ